MALHFIREKLYVTAEIRFESARKIKRNEIFLDEHHVINTLLYTNKIITSAIVRLLLANNCVCNLFREPNVQVLVVCSVVNRKSILISEVKKADKAETG